MPDVLSNPYTIILLGDIVGSFLNYILHMSFYEMRKTFRKCRIVVFLIYILTGVTLFYINSWGIAVINLLAGILSYLVPLFICYKVNNSRGIIYFIFFLAIEIILESVLAFCVEGLMSMDGGKVSYEAMMPQSFAIVVAFQIILVRVISLVGNKEKNKKLDRELFPYLLLPIATIIIVVFDGISYLGQDGYNLSQYSELMVILVAINILVFVLLDKYSRLMILENTERENKLKLQADAEIMKIATKAMKERIAVSENIMQQDRAMRHDRRHFEALLQTLLQEGNTQEAIECLNERLNQEPHGVKKYCENTTLNAAITHYVAVAEEKSIKVNISATIPADLNVDEMQLAIVISNLIENAIHACEKVPENERRIDINARYKSQLLIEISNSCADKIVLDAEGHPFSNEENHGIGTRSVLNFINQTDSEIRYIAEEKTFKVRMLVS